jgi:hypothetical protein
MREGTRARFAERYSRDVNYRQLRAIYDDAIAEFAAA